MVFSSNHKKHHLRPLAKASHNYLDPNKWHGLSFDDSRNINMAFRFCAPRTNLVRRTSWMRCDSVILHYGISPGEP